MSIKLNGINHLKVFAKNDFTEYPPILIMYFRK